MSDTMLLEYAEGWAVGHRERNELLREAYDQLLKDPAPEAFCDISTGDAYCIATKRTDSAGYVTIDVLDCTVRRHAMVILPPGESFPTKLDIRNG